jgi:L-threonylcarbamoyladenylate synthase
MTRPGALDEAAAVLAAGAVVALPTDTVYGLAADPSVPGATDALFELKGRPETHGLPVLVADLAQAETFAQMTDPARRLADAFWPGALTIVVARRAGNAWSLGGDGRTVGVRSPAHAIARSLCAAVGPLATTSANRHGAPPLVDAAAVREAFGGALGVVIDGGRCAGAPSTVVALVTTPARCLRHGALSWEEIEAVLRR